MIDTYIEDNGNVSITSDDSVIGLQVIRILPTDELVEIIIDGRHHCLSREALTELAAQFTTIVGA